MLKPADELAARDNYHGQATWRRIIEAVGQLVNTHPPQKRRQDGLEADPPSEPLNRLFGRRIKITRYTESSALEVREVFY